MLVYALGPVPLDKAEVLMPAVSYTVATTSAFHYRPQREEASGFSRVDPQMRRTPALDTAEKCSEHIGSVDRDH